MELRRGASEGGHPDRRRGRLTRPIILDGRPEPLSDAVLRTIADAAELTRRYHSGRADVEEIESRWRTLREDAAANLELPAGGAVIFCSSGVEAINAAIKGLAWGSDGGAILIAEGDPEGFSEAAVWCERFGFSKIALPLSEGGAVDVSGLERLSIQRAAVGAFSTVTPEIYTPRDLHSLIQGIRNRSGSTALDVTMELWVRSASHAGTIADVLLIDGAGIGAPESSGLLWVKEGTRWSPLISGGAAQDGYRGGAIDLASAAGLVEAIQETRRLGIEHHSLLHETALESIADSIEGAILPWAAIPMTLGVTFLVPGVEGEAVVERAELEGVFVSTGSRCSRSAGKPSSILTGVGFSPEEASSAVSLTFRREHSPEDIKKAISILGNVIRSLRQIARHIH